ncbi:MAG: RHS repeat domain-containing protein, partial [Pigmentiphaga sp.]
MRRKRGRPKKPAGRVLSPLAPQWRLGEDARADRSAFFTAVRALVARASWLWAAALVPALAPAQAMEPPAADWSCGPPALGAPCPQGGPATLPLGDGVPRVLGNPVNLSNGHKYQREVDWHAYEGELGLEVVRHYHSADPRDTGLGRGWRLSYDTRLYPVGRGWQIVQADGSRLMFAPPESPGQPCRVPGTDAGELLPLPEGGYLWRWPSGRLLRFDARGKLVEIRTPSGALLFLHYGMVPGRDDFGRLLRVRDPRGREINLHYQHGRLAEIRLPDGWLQYWHTSGRRLRAVAYPSGRARFYAYEVAHQGGSAPGDAHAANARLTATWWWDPALGLMPRWAWSYDEHGRVVAAHAGGRQSGESMALRYPATSEAWQVAIQSSAATHTWKPPPHSGSPPRTESGAPGSEQPQRLSRPSRVAGRSRQLQFDWNGPADFAGQLPGLPWRVIETGWRLLNDTGQAAPVRREWWWERTNAASQPGLAGDSATSWQLRRRGAPVIGSHAVDALSAAVPGGEPWPTATALTTAAATATASAAEAWPRIDTASRSSTEGGAEFRVEAAQDAWPRLRVWRDDFGKVWRWSNAITGPFVRDTSASEASAESWQFANGDIWTFHYDADGRLRQWLRRSAQGGEDNVNVMRTPGRLRIEHPHETQDWAFPAGQVDVAQRRTERPALGGAPAWHYEESFQYDAAGHILRHHLPEGGRLEYLRDAGGRPVRITWWPVAGPPRVLYQRTAMGLRLANGSLAGSVFEDGRLVFLWQSLRGRPLLAHRRAYDAEARLGHESIRVAGGKAMHRALGYDAAGRLAITKRPDGFDWRAWAASGEARAWQSAAGMAAGTVAQRDASGLPLAAAGWQLRYGADRRLAGAERPGGARVRYFRNAFGELIGRRDDQGVGQALYVGHQRVAEWGWRGGAWRVLRRLVLADELPVAWIEYGPSDASHGVRPANPRPGAGSVRHAATQGQRGAPGPSVAPESGGSAPALTPELFTLHADAMGVPLAATDDAGRLRWSADVDAWGRLLQSRGALHLALRLPGQWADPLTGWHDNYQRTYHPGWGHYLEPDPAGPPGVLAPGVGSKTPFGYAAHQPRRWLDPTGLVLFAFDGTLQSAASGANVYRLSLWYRDHAAVAAGLQSAYYEAGPGGWPLIDLDAAVGWSADRILQSQWDRLLQHLSAVETAADPVALDLLGYSRGAALARHFANLILGKVRQGRFWEWDDELGTVTAGVD